MVGLRINANSREIINAVHSFEENNINVVLKKIIHLCVSQDPRDSAPVSH